MDDETGVASAIDHAMTSLLDQGWVVLSDLLDDRAIDAAEEPTHRRIDRGVAQHGARGPVATRSR